MTDIVERLRQYEVGNLALQETWVGEMREAADEIERLRAENIRLRVELDFLRRAMPRNTRKCTGM